MYLEKYIDQGIMMERIFALSKHIPITLDNGMILVGNARLGMRDTLYTIALFEDALDAGYRYVGEKANR